MEDFDFAVKETINNLSLAGVRSIFEPIVETIEKMKGQYGKLLRATAIGRNAPPNFGGQPLEWTALSEKWMKRKRTYPNPAFYRGLSNTEDSLAKALFSLPGENLFGRTQMRTRLEQVETDGFYNPRIRRRINSVFRDDRGRFMQANAEARRTVKVIVNPFPNIDRDSDSMIAALPIGAKNKIKLFSNDEHRPLIEPYTEWFFERKLRAKIISMAQGIRNGSK